MNRFQEAIAQTPAWSKQHEVLRSGLHTEAKLDMEVLSGYAQPYSIVMNGIKAKLREQGLKVVVPVPNGARDLALPVTYPPEFFVVRTRKPSEGEKSFSLNWSDAITVRRAGRMAIFEDVVTTGGSSAAMAQAVREYNPDAELHLVGIWRRGELTSEAAACFASQAYLVEEPIPAWPAGDCQHQECSGA